MVTGNSADFDKAGVDTTGRGSQKIWSLREVSEGHLDDSRFVRFGSWV